MSCDYCELKDEELIFANEQFSVFVPEKSSVLGHIVVVPNKHYRILEEVSDEEVGVLFNAANQMSALIFETLGVSGTNILVFNGTPGQSIPHFSINILPRREMDNLDLLWEPKPGNQAELDNVMNAIKAGLEGKVTPEREEVSKSDGKSESANEKDDELDDVEKIDADEEENYMVKQLERMP